jgi:hypothetical protein
MKIELIDLKKKYQDESKDLLIFLASSKTEPIA